MRDKFTAHELTLHLQQETLRLYRSTLDLALRAAHQAQHAFNIERGHTTRHFVGHCGWDNLREGLLAGERLSASLRHMEKAYLDENVREYELTKNFSLRLHFPCEYLRLRTTGRCEIEIPEWMYDLETPGMYMRRIKSASLKIPAVTGSYTGVHCRLTLLASTTRIDPSLRPPAHECCCPPEPCPCGCTDPERAGHQYELCLDDPRALRQYDAREAIATSTGQNDSGLFQLNFDDPRRLPFEYIGAAMSRWRIELPPENNYFDFDTLSDVIIRMNYTAREGGEPLRRAATASAHHHLPGDGWRFFDVRHEFPDAWRPVRESSGEEYEEKRLRLRIARNMFPFIPGSRDLWVEKYAIVFGTCGGTPCDPRDVSDCPCPPRPGAALREVEFVRRREDECEEEEEEDVRCIADERSSGFYCGIFESLLGPLKGDRHEEFDLRFPPETGSVESLFLLCRYRVRTGEEPCEL